MYCMLSRVRRILKTAEETFQVQIFKNEIQIIVYIYLFLMYVLFTA